MVDETGALKKQGDKFKIPKFAATLRAIAQYGVDIFYNGTLGEKLVEDIRQKGGIITKEDLRDYRYLIPVRNNVFSDC